MFPKLMIVGLTPIALAGAVTLVGIGVCIRLHAECQDIRAKRVSVVDHTEG